MRVLLDWGRKGEYLSAFLCSHVGVVEVNKDRHFIDDVASVSVENGLLFQNDLLITLGNESDQEVN